MSTPLEISIACWYATPAGKTNTYRVNTSVAFNECGDFGNNLSVPKLTEKGLAWVQSLTQCQPPTVRYIAANGMEVKPYEEPSTTAGIPCPPVGMMPPYPPPAPFKVSQATLDDVRAVHEARERGDIE